MLDEGVNVHDGGKPMNTIRLAAVSAVAVVAASFAVPSNASAMPIGGLAPASTELASGVENVAWVCGPYRCWWRPNYWAGGPSWHRGWGWHRPWGWHRRWAWHRW